MTNTFNLLSKWVNPLHLPLFQDILFIFGVGITFTLILPLLSAMLFKTKNANGGKEGFIVRFKTSKIQIFASMLVVISIGFFITGIKSVSIGQLGFAVFLFAMSTTIIVAMLYLFKKSKVQE